MIFVAWESVLDHIQGMKGFKKTSKIAKINMF